MSFLKIENLKSGYGKLQVLFGVDMEFKPDDITVIIGPNGAGKSTVLKSIFRLCDIFSGKILYKCEDITKLPTYDRIKLGISFVPQGRQVFSGLTVKENLEMGAFLIGNSNLLKKRLAEVLHHFPVLKEKLHHNAYNLSGGQQQMLAIARGLMQDPKVLLLDEPSLGLAPKTMKEIFAKIQEINKEGTAVIIVEQNAKAACEIADKIYVLEEGRVALHGSKKIMKSKKIKNIYLGGHGHR